jgi:urea transport system permease protein
MGFSQLRPNGGVRAMIGAALVQFQLPIPTRDAPRRAGRHRARCRGIHLAALRVPSLDGEDDPDILAAKQRLERILTIASTRSEASASPPSKALPATSASMCAPRSIR